MKSDLEKAFDHFLERIDKLEDRVHTLETIIIVMAVINIIIFTLDMP